MPQTGPLLVVGALLTLAASFGFTNAMEYVQSRAKLGSSLVGGIISPLFTSMPETTVFVIAVFVYRGGAGNEIGIGTIFGQPLMASSVSYALVLLSVALGLKFGKREKLGMVVDRGLATPYALVTILFPLLFLPSLLGQRALQLPLAAVFGASYLFFAWTVSKKKKTTTEEFNDTSPYLARLLNPTAAAAVQLVAASVGLYLGAESMVSSMAELSALWNVSPIAISIVIVPLSTAIPETITAMIWGYKGRDTLSISSLVGEKILYSSFYPAIALATIPWVTDVYADISILVTTGVSAMFWFFIRKGKIPYPALALGVPFFVLFSVLAFHG